jgi:hypothetical protein
VVTRNVNSRVPEVLTGAGGEYRRYPTKEPLEDCGNVNANAPSTALYSGASPLYQVPICCQDELVIGKDGLAAVTALAFVSSGVVVTEVCAVPGVPIESASSVTNKYFNFMFEFS